jgi:hypothetical protein
VGIVGLALLVTACSSAASTTSAPVPSATTNPSSELLDLGKRWAATEATVTYKVEESASSSASPSPPIQVTIDWKPPGSWRADIREAGQPPVSYIEAGTVAYFCVASSTKTCLQAPQAAGGSLAPFLRLFASPGALRQQITGWLTGATVRTSTRTIAGRQARCFIASSTIAGSPGTAEWCFSPDGILLLFAGAASGQSSGSAAIFRMEATRASPTVSDADFTPPYPVKSLTSPTP